MKVFKSNLFNSFFYKIIQDGGLFFFLYFFLKILAYFDVFYFSFPFLQLIILYPIFLFIYLLFTNSNLMVDDESISVESSILKKYRTKNFKKKAIRTITFKEDWTENFMNNKIYKFIFFRDIIVLLFPNDYKWIKIVTHDNKEFTFYFFGMEYDYFDNYKEVLFEDMFIDLAKHNIEVKWNAVNDRYFESLQKQADKIRLDLNKKQQ